MAPERIEEALSCHLAQNQVDGLVVVEGFCGGCTEAAEEARARYRLGVDEWVRYACGRAFGPPEETPCSLCQRGEQ
jgi:hypothetical protein